MVLNKEYTEDATLERIKLVIEKYSKSEAEFARRINVPKSTLNTMFHRSKNASFRVLEAILSEFTDVSADWLLRGIGEMELTSTPEIIKTTIADANKYLVERFEAVLNELHDIKDEVKKKDEIIAKQQKEIEKLKSRQIYTIEKKDGDVGSIAAEPSSELKG